MNLKKYFYRKEDVKRNNNSIESVNENKVKMLKFYINGERCTHVQHYI